MFRRPFPLALASVLAASAPLVAEPEPAAPPAGEIRDTIQVTATRVPEDVLDVPASVTVVSAEELTSDRLLVSILAPEGDAVAVAARAGSGSLRLVQVSP